MPLYDLTSPASGQTYRVNFDGDPQDADIEEAVRSFDAEEFAARGGEGDPNAAMQQGPVGTFINAVPQALAKFGTQVLGGAAKLMGTATDYVAGVTGTQKGGFFDEAAQSYDAMTTEANRTFPTNPFNTKTATVGSGVGQGMAMLGGGAAARGLGMGGTALTTVPLVAGGLAGAGQGIDTAKEIGVQHPLDQLAMGLLYGGVEVVTEKLGGFGNQAATEALLAPIKKSAAQLLKQAAKTTLSESGEEVLAEGAQALITRAYADEDPARPGFTKTGVELPKLDRKMADRLGLAALGGAAGGAVFAGVQTLDDIQQPPALPADAQPTTAQRNRRPVEVVPAPPLSTLARIAAESVAPEGDTGALTAEDLEAEGSAGTPARMARPLPQPILQGVGQLMSDPLPSTASVTKESGATADQTAQNTLGAGLSPATGSFSYNLTSPTTGQTYQVEFDREPQDTDIEEAVAALDAEASASAQSSVLSPQTRTPEQMAESAAAEQARQAQVARLRMIDNKAQGMPMIADSPSGSLDILDFANENPIYLPPGFSEQRNLPEYEKLKESKLPPYWRQFIASNKRGGNPNTVAQRAFDAGFIAEPTADAYINALREGIDGRQQYRAQFAIREKAMATEEKQVVAFDKSQTKLAKKPDAQEVPFEDVLPGDQMTIDGEQAVVKNVEFNEDGYLTNVVIEDGKRFGLMNFDPQTRGGILVDEYQPKAARTQAAASDFAPASPSPSLPVSQSPSLDSLLQGTESTRPKNKGETTRDQNADPLGELMGAKLAGEAEQAQTTFKNLNVNGSTAGFANADILAEAADLIRQGFTNFANWSQAMLTRFGRGIRDYLAGIWQQVKDGAGDALMSYLEKTGAVKNFQPSGFIPKARTTVFAEASKPLRNRPANLSRDDGTGAGNGWNREMNMSENAASAINNGRLMEPDFKIWLAGHLRVPVKAITKAVLNSANINSQNIFREYHHVGSKREIVEFYDPAEIELAPKFFLGAAQELKLKSHQDAARRAALTAWQTIRDGLAQAGDLGTWTFAEVAANKGGILDKLDPQFKKRVDSGEMTVPDAVRADLARILAAGRSKADHLAQQAIKVLRELEAKRDSGQGNERTLRQIEDAKNRISNVQEKINAEIAKQLEGHPSTKMVAPVARDGQVESSAKPESADAPTRAEDDRVTDRATEVTSDSNATSPQSGKEVNLKNLNVSGRTAGFANADILAEAADLIRQGITDFTNWSRAMLTRFGRGIQDYLAGIWQQVLKSLPNNAVQNVRMGRAQGTAPLSLPNSGAVINPFTPSDAPGWMRTLFKVPSIGAFRVQNLKVRQLLTGSALPKAMAEIVTASTRDKQSIEYAAAALANDLEQAMKAHSQVTGQSEQQINNLVTDVLQGTVPLSIILNPTLRTAIRRARNLLDNLSTAVGNATGGTLGQTITANLGQWMRRSYAAFDPDAGWSFDALTEAATKNRLVAGVSAAKILRDARNYLRTQTPGITNGELEAQMRQLMDRNLWEEALAGSGAGVRKDVTSLMKRKDIAPEILALMGEERNPVKKLLGSTKWQAQYIAKHDNQVKLRDLGLQLGMMSPTQTGRFTEAMGEDRSTSGFAVNGKSVYTTQELKAALNQTVGVIPTEDLGGSLIKLIYWLGGQAKLNKVALNPDSWLVNLMGNVTGLAMTGALSPFAPMRLFQNSRKAIELMRAGQKQSAAGTQAQVQNDLMRGMMAKLTAAGVADSSMNAALVEDALNKSLVQFIEKHDVWNGAVGAVKLAVIGQALAVPFGVTGRVVGGAVGGAAGYFIGNERVQNVQEAVAKWTMQNPDRFGKIVEFLDNHTTLLAAGMTPDQAFAKATAKTLNTMPDYSKLPPVLRQFSRLGVVGSFIAFQWEVYRNSFHNAKYIVEELGSGNRALMEKGARRLLGMSSVYALALGGLQALLGNDAGDDDKDEAYRRALGKPWEKFTRLAYTRLDTEKASFYNTSYLLPQVTLTNVIRAAMEGKDFPQAMEFVGSTLQNQFLESGIHADPLIALLFNIDRGGQKASTEEGWRATVERLAEVLAPMTPGAADKFERILRSKEVLNQPRWDREFSVEEEMKRLLGIRQSTYAHDRRIAGRLSEFNNRKRDIAASAAQVYGSTGKAKADVWGQQQQQEAAQRATERLADLKAEYDQFVIDLGTLGFTPYQIQRFRKDAGTSPNWRPYGITPDGIKQPVTR